LYHVIVAGGLVLMRMNSI